MTSAVSDLPGSPKAGSFPPPRDGALLSAYLGGHLAVAAGLAIAALVALVVLAGSLGTLRRVEARSIPLPGIVVEQLPTARDGWERLSLTYSASDRDVQAAVTVGDAHAYRVGQRVDLLVDPRLPAQPVLASELPEPWPVGMAAGLALAASVAIAARTTRWVRRLRRLVSCPAVAASEGVMSAQLSEGRGGLRLELSEGDGPAAAPKVVFPLMASQLELVAQDRPFPCAVVWDPRDPSVMVAMVGGRVLWPRGRVRRERGAGLARPEHAASTRRGNPRGSDGGQALSMPARPASTTNDVRVAARAPGRETYGTTR